MPTRTRNLLPAQQTKKRRGRPPNPNKPAPKPKLTADERRAILVANAAKARAARSARAVERKRTGVPAARKSAKPQAIAPTIGNELAAGSPEPYLLTPKWRIVALDARQWTLQTRATNVEAADDEAATDGWRSVGYYGDLSALCQQWAQRYARTSSGPLLQAVASAASRLRQVLAELKVAAAGI